MDLLCSGPFRKYYVMLFSGNLITTPCNANIVGLYTEIRQIEHSLAPHRVT